MLWGLALGFLEKLIGPIFSFLNARVDAEKQIQITKTTAVATVATAGLEAESKADELNARVRMSEGRWGPTVLMMMVILMPFVWHEWQVVLDSSRWVPAVLTWYGFPYVTVAEHAVGSWRVAALPDPWGAVELSIFQSFFIGAAASVSAIAAIRAIKK